MSFEQNRVMPKSLTPLQKQILLNTLFKEKLKKSLFAFYQELCKVLEPNTQWSFNWHHEYICNILQEEILRIKRGEPRKKHLIINVPPRTSKSLILIAAEVWSWIHSDIQWISLSYSAGLANDHSNKIMEFLNSPFVAKFFKTELALAPDHQSKTDFKLIRGGSRISAGLTGAVLGRGANIIVLDDPQDPKDLTQLGIHNTIRAFTDTVSTRLNNPFRDIYILVQQRLHQSDLSGYLLSEQPSKWFHINLPAIFNSKITPSHLSEFYKDDLLWSNWLTRDVLADKKLNLGSQGFANQFMQNPVAEGGNIIKNNWIQIMSETVFNELMKIKNVKPEWNIYLDSAQTMKTKNDPSGILIGCKVENIFYVKKFIQEYLEFPDLIRRLTTIINEIAIENPAVKMFVEPKSNGKDIVSYFKSNAIFPVVELSAPSIDKMARIKAVSPQIESGRLVLLEHTSNQEALEQLCGFPNVNHDEFVDLVGYLMSSSSEGSGQYCLSFL